MVLFKGKEGIRWFYVHLSQLQRSEALQLCCKLNASEISHAKAGYRVYTLF